MIAASILLNADVALGTLRRQKGAIRLTHHQAGFKTNYTKLLASVPSSSSCKPVWGGTSHLNVAGRWGWNSNSRKWVQHVWLWNNSRTAEPHYIFHHLSLPRSHSRLSSGWVSRKPACWERLLKKSKNQHMKLSLGQDTWTSVFRKGHWKLLLMPPPASIWEASYPRQLDCETPTAMKWAMFNDVMVAGVLVECMDSARAQWPRGYRSCFPMGSCKLRTRQIWAITALLFINDHSLFLRLF